MRIRAVALIALLFSCLSLSARPAPELRFLSAGQRLKIEGRLLPDGQLAARKVEAAPAGEDLEIEGVIRELDRTAGTFAIGPWKFRVSDKTKFENSARQPRTFAQVAKKNRVKVRFRSFEGRELAARSVRICDGSSDTDIEITGPVQALDVARAQLALAGARVRVDARTEYVNIPGLEASNALLDSEVNRRIRRDDDEQHPDPIRIGRVYIGGRLGFDYEESENRDLNDAGDDRHRWLTPGAQIELSAPLGEFSEAYARLQFYQPTYAGRDPGERGRSDFNAKEAYLYVGNFLHRSLGLQIGRQRFRDRREWLYDNELDAVRLHFARSNLKVELSAAKGLFGPTGSRSDQYYFIAHSQYRLPGRRYISAYALKRNDLTPRDEDPVWIGLSSRGRVAGGLDYWAELSSLRGRRGANLLRGHGFDFGGSYRFFHAWQPSVSAGYAFGSGDANPNDGLDGNFRQTALQDNSFRNGGLKRYRYYGLVVDPELNNLRTLTLDAGVQPSREWSLNVNYHTYRQAVASRRLGDSELGLRPTGRDPRLGQEFDLVIVLRKIRGVDLSLTAGVFLPGPAFAKAPSAAFVLRPEVRYYF